MTTITDNLIDNIRAVAFMDMDEDVPLEEIKGQIIDNTETIKKIEESRVFVSMEKNGYGEGLRDKSIPIQSSSSSSSTNSSTTQKPYVPYQSPYGNNSYIRTVESLDQKACEATSTLFKKLDDRAKNKVKSRETINITNWTMLESLDEAELAKREGKKIKKKITKKQAKRKIFVYQMALALIKGAMESLFVAMKERK